MVFEIDGRPMLKSQSHTWVLRWGEGTRHFATLPDVANALVKEKLIRPDEAQRLETAHNLAREVAARIQTMPNGVTAAFADGGFTILRERWAYTLANPTLEVPRLPEETGKDGRRSVVGFYASTEPALLAALERVMQICPTTLPYSSLDQVAFKLASELWSDLSVVQPTAHDGNSRAADMRIRRFGSDGRLQGLLSRRCPIHMPSKVGAA